MIERRAWWTDDLIESVSNSFEAIPLRGEVYAVIAAVEDWVLENYQGGEYDNPVEFTPEEAAIARVREEVGTWPVALDKTVAACADSVLRALDGGAE